MERGEGGSKVWLGVGRWCRSTWGFPGLGGHLGGCRVSSWWLLAVCHFMGLLFLLI